MKSEKIIFQGKEFFIDIDSLEDPNVEKLFLYKDSDLKKPLKTPSGRTRMVHKEDIEEVLKENAGGAGGAGYAVYGGGWGRTFGNPSMGGRFYGRGFGFGNRGGSSSGPNLMYTYSIKPLDPILQQPATPQGDERYVHIGSHITGKELNKEKEVDGKIITIKEDGEGNILYYLVQDFDTAERFKVDPTSATLISNEDRPQSMADFVGEGEEFYPRLSEANNFKKGQNPKKSMNIGLFSEQIAKILNHIFFQYQNGSPIITKWQGEFFDTDGYPVDPDEIIEWAKEILDDFPDEIRMDKSLIEKLKKDLDKGKLSGFYPTDDKIPERDPEETIF